jgi:hypothetical protein
MKLYARVKNIYHRVMLALFVLFKYEHFFCVNITRKDLAEILSSDKEFDMDCNLYAVGLARYNVLSIIRLLNGNITDTDMSSEKANFEREVESFIHPHKKEIMVGSKVTIVGKSNRASCARMRGLDTVTEVDADVLYVCSIEGPNNNNLLAVQLYINEVALL